MSKKITSDWPPKYEKISFPKPWWRFMWSPNKIKRTSVATCAGALELSSLSGGRLFAEIGTSWDLADNNAILGITPRVACYEAIDGLDGACGFGGSIELTKDGEDTDWTYSVNLDLEFGEGYERGALSGSVSRRLSVGALNGSAKLAPEGAMSLGGAYELKF